MQEPGWLTGLRAMATTYTVVSGAVFGVLLANAELFGHLFLVPLSSQVLHFVLPVGVVTSASFSRMSADRSWRVARSRVPGPAR